MQDLFDHFNVVLGLLTVEWEILMTENMFIIYERYQTPVVHKWFDFCGALNKNSYYIYVI